MLFWPPTVTTTFATPAVRPFGTGTVMLPVFQMVGVVGIPLNVTVLAPWTAPKFVPVIVTGVPTGPKKGETVDMLGGGAVTVNVVLLLA